MSYILCKTFCGYLPDIWAASWQNQQNDCAPSEDSSDQSLRCVLNG